MLFQLIQGILSAYFYVLIATAFISWVPDLADTQLGHILSRLTEPYLRPFRRYIPPVQLGGIMLDLSFLVAVIVYFFIKSGIISLLVSLLLRVQS